jgi:hypothetical protein
MMVRMYVNVKQYATLLIAIGGFLYLIVISRQSKKASGIPVPGLSQKGPFLIQKPWRREYAQSASCQDLTHPWVLLQQTFLGQMGITVMERPA